MNENSILVVSDMQDLRDTRAADPKFLNMDFAFSSRSATKFMGWHQEAIYVTARAEHNMSHEIRKVIALRRSKGALICPVN